MGTSPKQDNLGLLDPPQLILFTSCPQYSVHGDIGG